MDRYLCLICFLL
uniref:Uncharacterized protein n=1 Tax=Anguilla anguilla TaxID=7936 RepID=A0A0E9TG37_ANGAN